MASDIWPGFLEAETRPLTQDETAYYIQFFLLSKQTMLPAMLASLRKSVFLFNVLEARLGVFDKDGNLKSKSVLEDPIANEAAGRPDIDLFCILWCAFLSGTPGDAVMWAYTLWLLWRRSGQKVTLDTWVEAFPNGVPTEDEKQRLWQEQKQSSGPQNYMDDLGKWPKDVPEDSSIIAARLRTRAEHLEHCKELAYRHLDKNPSNTAKVYSIFCNELNKHPETYKHPAVELGMLLLMSGANRDPANFRQFIEEFN